jgi:hypothetical protein
MQPSDFSCRWFLCSSISFARRRLSLAFFSHTRQPEPHACRLGARSLLYPRCQKQLLVVGEVEAIHRLVIPIPPLLPRKSGNCQVPPHHRRADTTRPKSGGTSSRTTRPANFPCRASREATCRGEKVLAWAIVKLDWGGAYRHPHPLKPVDVLVNYHDFDVMTGIVDVEAERAVFDQARW